MNNSQQNIELNLSQKQQYLRKAILQSGKDAQKFVQFCQIKHNLDELQNWTYAELVAIVNEFLELYQEHHQQKQPIVIQSHQTTIQSNKKQIIQEDQFGQFQKIVTSIPTNTKTIHLHPTEAMPSHQLHANNEQNATNSQLLFSDLDWDMLLQDKEKSTVNIKNHHQNEQPPKVIKKQTTKENYESNKDFPLSPPSISHPMAIQELTKKSSDIIEVNEQELSMKTELKQANVNINKITLSTASKSQEIINFSNILIKTLAERQLPLLPHINDISVQKTEQVSRSFLQSDYTLYHIYCSPAQHHIQRKFNDFRKLRAILQRSYPHLRLPYLEPEGWLSGSEGKDGETLAKYKYMIEEFMKFILIRSDQLKNTALVRLFCGFSVDINKHKQKIIKQEDLKKIFEFYDSEKHKPKNISEMLLKQNEIIIPPMTNGQKVVTNTLDLMINIESHYDKLKKQLQTLFYNYEILSKSILEVSSTFESLENLIKQYNFQTNPKKDLRVYQGLREVTIKFQSNINEQQRIFKHKIRNLFRYEKDNMSTLKEIIENRSRIHYEFGKQNCPGMSSSSFKVQSKTGVIEVEASNILLMEPNKNNKNLLAVQEVFWSFCIERQISRYWTHLRNKINENLTAIAYDELDSQNENLNFWNSAIKKCVV